MLKKQDEAGEPLGSGQRLPDFNNQSTTTHKLCDLEKAISC